MFASPARHLLLATFIVVCVFLQACGTTPEVTTNVNQPTPEVKASYVPPPPTNIANGKQTTGLRYEGFLDQADCNTVWGWVWNKDQKKPNEVLYVEILSDGTPISTIPASEARWSVVPITGDDGYHGFVYKVHPSLKTGKAHVIQARVSQTDSELQNSPKTIVCTQ